MTKLRSVLGIRGIKFGICPVCNKNTVFILNDELWKIRNHAKCIHCHSCSRHRHVAYCIVKALENKGIKAYTDLCDRPDISIYFAETQSPLINEIGNRQNLTTSEYFDDCNGGETKNGILCQDLQKLTFKNESFNIVVTQDIFEHVENWISASREIFRVLKPSGAHVFSLPFYFQSHTKKLFDYVDGKFIPTIMPVEYHGDGIREKIPTYNHFGFDMIGEMTKVGFDVSIDIPKYKEHHKLGLFDCYTFIAFKR